MDFEEISYDKSEHIATITLNRPERMNAFGDRMIGEWVAALEDARLDDDVRVIILTGAGRGFCAGMDVKASAEGRGLDRAATTIADRRNWLKNSVQRVPRLLTQLDKPYIAAVNGPAAGAGMDMASMADIRIAAESARFSMAYVRMGLIPGDGGCYYLPRIIGTAKALEYIWTGDTMSAEEALRLGYVSKVVPDDKLMEEARAFAARLASGPAVAIQLAKRLVYRSWEVDANKALEMAESAMLVAQSTEDAKEGPRAFVEKRPPQFQGR
ncbi:MAG TPA: enoyl-CoA hydratase-related protein [Dehalococcoidia bacterium]|nr:enoyl-CoA hydratase-related protein [Dehalococcoidia bacterium]